jgi:hypothetical protein
VVAVQVGKRAPDWKGLMRVLGMHNERVARLWDPAGGREILRHVSHLKEYDTRRTSLDEALGFDLPEGFFIVEKVLDHRAKPRHEVLIHWANTEPEEDTWEPLSGEDIRNNTLVREVCAARGIRMPPVRRARVASEEDSEWTRNGKGLSRLGADGRGDGRTINDGRGGRRSRR